MLIPQKIVDIDLYTKFETVYKFNRVCYKGCYEYIHFWQSYDGKWHCFKKYLENGNILYSAWLYRFEKDYWSRFSYRFEGEIEK